MNSIIPLIVSITYFLSGVPCPLCLSKHSFPPDFLWSSATASYQVEGAWNADGKGENIWDRLVHTRPNLIEGNATGDVACDTYHKYKEDVVIMKDIGFNAYRFSISWSRVMPTGDINVINQKGIDYYKNLINELKLRNIEPMVTLYHWDLPQPLQDLGGWSNGIIADYFEAYADVCFKNFGSKVKFWITLNEPREVTKGYGGPVEYAPHLNETGVGEYLAGHNLLRAHAKAYRLYEKRYKEIQKGQVGITLNSEFVFPFDNSSKADKEAAERYLQFTLGWFANPIYSKLGDYPSIMRQIIDQNSAKEGRVRSRLPRFTSDEINALRGSADFFGLNHYTSYLVKCNLNQTYPYASNFYDIGVSESVDPKWPSSASRWLKVVPQGFRRILNWIKKTYGNRPIIYVTENGFSDSGTLQDDGRISYYSSYLLALQKAIYNDKVNVKGYTVWSLMDNFEWMDGYTALFGIVKVDFHSPNRTRIMKKSGTFWKRFLSNETQV